MKRKRLTTTDTEKHEPTKRAFLDKEGELDFDALPIELVDAILRNATSMESSALYTCRLTCRLWRDILPPPPKRIQEKKTEGARKKQENEEKKKKTKGLDFALRVAKEGNVSLLQWGISNGAPFKSDEILSAAVSQGHLTLLRWLCEHGCPMDALRCAEVAARNGHTEALKWILAEARKKSEDGFWFESHVFYQGAKGGHKKVIELMRAEGFQWEGRTFLAALKGGNLDLVQWLVELNQCFPSSLPGIAEHAVAGRGGVGLLEYLKKNGSTWTSDAVKAAAMKGNLETLQWLRGNTDADWHPKTCVAVIKGKSPRKLELLEWLHENGCPWNSELLWRKAATKGEVGVLAYLEKTGSTRKE